MTELPIGSVAGDAAPRRIWIVSPHRGDTDVALAENAEYALAAARDCFERGEWPMLVHGHGLGLYVQALDDDDASDRELGMSAARAWMDAAVLVAVYVDRGVSGGMRDDIAWCEARDIPIETRTLPPKPARFPWWRCIMQRRHDDGTYTMWCGREVKRSVAFADPNQPSYAESFYATLDAVAAAVRDPHPRTSPCPVCARVAAARLLESVHVLIED